MPTPSRKRTLKPDSRRALELFAGCGAESPAYRSRIDFT
jgi:hypothetical protein